MTAPAVVVYSRAECHLCEQALDMLRRIGGELAFELEVRDVDADPALAERYGATVPVVTVDGREVSAGRFAAAAVRGAIRASGTAAVDSSEARS